MLEILGALIVGAAVTGILLCHASDSYSVSGAASTIIGIFLAMAVGVSSIAYVFCGWSWLAAESKANIINREYGTNYTQAEVFYASDVIETIRHLDRNRIEINGDIMRDKETK